jgi:hypothetical protein
VVGLTGYESQDSLLRELDAERARHAAWQQVLSASPHRATAAHLHCDGDMAVDTPLAAGVTLYQRLSVSTAPAFIATVSTAASGVDPSKPQRCRSSPSVTAQWAEQRQAPACGGAAGWPQDGAPGWAAGLSQQQQPPLQGFLDLPAAAPPPF